MVDPAMAAPPKKALPFKRTVARRKDTGVSATGATSSKEDDDDDGVDLFRRVNDELPEMLQEQERRLKRTDKRTSSAATTKTDPDGEDVKRRKLSRDSHEESRRPSTPRRSVSNRGSIPRSASKPKTPTSAVLDDNDIIVGVKGRGKDIFKSLDSPQTKKTPPRNGTSLANGHNVDMPPPPQPPRSGSSSGRRTRSQRLLDPDPEVEVLPYLAEANNDTAKNLSDDDSDDDLKIMDGPPVVEDEVDDEFAEYVRRAHERNEEQKRQAKIKLERGSQATDSQESKPMGNGSFDAGNDANGSSQDSDLNEAVIEILVTSVLPHTKPRRIRRRLNQNFKVVRDTWASTQDPPIPMPMWPNYFLTWKGNRVYDTTSPFNLGIRVERLRGGGKPAIVAGASGAKFSHGHGLDNNGVHLEVWTDEAYREYIERKERERLRLLGELDDNDGDDDLDGRTPGSGAGGGDDSDGDGAGPAEVLTTIMLKAAKGYEPLKMKVPPTTTIGEIIDKFRSIRKVPEDKAISLFFDGEKLEERTTIQENDEIEDDDSIEVHIK